MVMLSISEIGTVPQTPSQALEDDLFFVVGATSASGADVPAVGVLTRCRSQAQADAFGDWADGTLPRALKIIYDSNPDADIVALRHDNGTTLTNVNAIGQAPNAERDFRKKVTGIVIADRSWNLAGNSVDNSSANALMTAARTQATNLKCIGFGSGPATNVSDFTGWLAVNSGDRMVGQFREVMVPGETEAGLPGAVAAAAVLKRRRTRGYHANPNFTELSGIASASPAIFFSTQSPTADSQLIVNAHGCTIIDDLGSFRFYGREMMQATASADHRNSISIRTTLDRLEQFAQAQLLLISTNGDGNLTPAFVDDTVGAVKREINRLLGIGAIQEGDCYPDPALDTRAERDLGNLHLVIIANGTRNVATISVRIVAG